jgi:hypothetical protein
MANPAAAAAGAGAAAVAAVAPTTLFQVKVGRMRNAIMLSSLRPYASQFGSGLNNCANLSLVYLGLLKDPVSYLETCTGRGIATNTGEIGEVIRGAVKKIGITLPPFVEGVNPSLGPVDAEHTFSARLREIGESLIPEHATIIGVQFADGSRHAAILKKEKNSDLIFEDYQIIMPDGSYPASTAVPDAGDQAVPYAQPITTVYAFLGPNLSEFHNLFFARYKATGNEGIYMNTLGGRHRRKKTMKRKVRKTRRSQKHKSR